MNNIPVKKSFVHAVGVLVAGAAGSQILTVIAAPLLTRLFTPNSFGLMAVYAGILSIFTVIASLRYELAIPIPADDSEAAEVVVLGLLILLAVSLLSGLILFSTGDSLSLLLGAPQLVEYLWLLPFGVLTAGSYQVLNSWIIRKKDFHVVATSRVTQVIGTTLVQIAGFKLGALALIGGQAVGQGLGGLQLGMRALKQLNLRSIKISRLKVVAQRYRHFPLYSTWAGLFNSLGSQLPTLMLAASFGAVAAGIYALAQRVLTLPMSIVGGAIGSVLLADAAEAYRSRRIAAIVARVHEKLTNVAMPPAFILLISGPAIFELVFGHQWREAGTLARWMAPWLYVVFVTSPLSMLFEVMEKQRQHLIFHAVLLVVRASAIAAGALTENLEITIALFSIGSACCWIWMLLWINSILENRWTVLCKSTGKSMAWALVCSAPLLAEKMSTEKIFSWYWFFGLSVAFSFAYYALVMRRTLSSANIEVLPVEKN